MTNFAQKKGYSTFENLFAYYTENFKNQEINGDIKSVTIYKNENLNFHEKSNKILLETGKLDCTKYIFMSKNICEMQFLNNDGTLRSKSLFSNNRMKESLFYDSKLNTESSSSIVYNELGQILEKKKKLKDGIEYVIKYTYNKNGYLESVIGDETYNYKYIYDELGGFYEVKYYVFKDKITIDEVRYNRHSNAESLIIILQNRPNIKFEDVNSLDKIWQSISKYDAHNRVIFEQSKNLLNNEVEIECSYSYNNKNQVLSKTYKTKNGTNDTYFYNYQDKRLVRQFAKDESGIENYNQLLNYNTNGDLIQKQSKGDFIKEETETYEYVYDLKNNWIERKLFFDNKLYEITFRDIEYEK